MVLRYSNYHGTVLYNAVLIGKFMCIYRLLLFLFIMSSLRLCGIF